MDWIPNQDEEFQKNYQELKYLIDQTLHKVRQLTDLREAKGLLIHVQNSFKGLRLNRDDREELYGRLQEAFGEINKKIANERSEFERVAQYNYADFKIRIEEAQFLANHPKDFHETWDHLIEVQNSFKEAKFLREHREELYLGLQKAFETLKKKKSAEKSVEMASSTQTFHSLRTQVEEILNHASTVTDFRLHKDEMIKLQALVRESNLVKEHRDELLGKLQEAFLIIQIRQDEEFQQIRDESVVNFAKFKPEADELLKQAKESSDFHQTRESIKSLQSEIRNIRLLKEQRDALHAILQEAFTSLSARQDNEQESFQAEAANNYLTLKILVEKGLVQAEETSKYKETREFLKKIQSEFKALKLLHDQREELYSRLQTAFSILNRRVDEFFREKKKNWMLKMQYKFTESSGEIFMLQQSLEKDQAYLDELEDQLEIVSMAGKAKEAIDGLQSRINSTKKTIERKKREIQALEDKMKDLQNVIEPPEPEV